MKSQIGSSVDLGCLGDFITQPLRDGGAQPKTPAGVFSQGCFHLGQPREPQDIFHEGRTEGGVCSQTLFKRWRARADKRDVSRTSETGNGIKYHWYLSFDHQKAFCTIRALVLLPPRNGHTQLRQYPRETASFCQGGQLERERTFPAHFEHSSNAHSHFHTRKKGRLELREMIFEPKRSTQVAVDIFGVSCDSLVVS